MYDFEDSQVRQNAKKTDHKTDKKKIRPRVKLQYVKKQCENIEETI